MAEITGWLLDAYAGAGGMNLWILGDDGRRYHLHHLFPMSFYAAGSRNQLRTLWKWLSDQPEPVHLARAERQDLFAGPTTVLAIEVPSASDRLRYSSVSAEHSPA